MTLSREDSFSNDEIRAQVRRITQSEGFRQSERLQEFLGYIVEEALAGRSALIKGVTIAQAVFSADESFDPESNAIVRVEAGRLRRRLEQYYLGPGQHDPWLITVPKGSYAPEFTSNVAENGTADPAGGEQESVSGRGRAWSWAAVAVAVAVAVTAWLFAGRQDPDRTEVAETGFSPVTTAESEAQILFQQAFVILMPPENRARLDTAIELFQSLSEQHPDFPGGYAGQSLAISVGVLFIKSRDRDTELEQAGNLARQSIAIDPDYSLGYAALAFAQSLDGEREPALANARRSIAIRKREPITPAMVSLTLLTSGLPRESIEVLSQAIEQGLGQPRTPYLNLLGISHFVVGQYEAAAENFELNLARNGPTGPHMDLFVAAVYGRLGREFQARAILEQFAISHPGYPAEAWLANYITQPDDLQSTLALLRELGLSESVGNQR